MSGRARAWPLYRRLMGVAARYWPLLAVATVGMAVEAAAAAGFSYLMKPIVDQTFVARDIDLILPLTIVGIFVLRGVATFVTDYGMSRSGRSVVRDLRQRMLAKYLRLPTAHFDTEAVPTLVSRLNYDTDQVAHAAAESMKIVITDSLTILFLLGVMFVTSVRVTLVMLIVAPLIGLIVNYVGRRYRRINRNIQDSVASLAQSAEQTIAAQQEVKVYGAQRQELGRYARLADRIVGLNVKVESTKATASSTVQLLAAIALAIILFVAGREAMAGRLSAGDFVRLMVSMMALLPSLKRVTTVQSQIGRGIAAAEKIFGLLDAPEERDEGRRPLARARGELVFRDVSVRYPSQMRAALEHVGFEARPGTVTAIVGRSGSGKSTLVRLLPRFYEPSAGQVLLDGEPLDAYALADLRRQIALVGQRVMLFDDTVAANIAYGQPDADPERIRAAAKAANALEFIERLPQGMDTRIGENGALLSGGQRQRLAIARAILKDAPILILDEATAALDTESERLVQDALDHLIPDRTTLVIAHRLSTIEHADQVLVLDEGRLVERGTHAELLAQGGTYAHLHRMQFREQATA